MDWWDLSYLYASSLQVGNCETYCWVSARNSSALAMELHLSCTNPSIYGMHKNAHISKTIFTIWFQICSWVFRYLIALLYFMVSDNWKLRIIRVPTLLLLVALQVVIMTGSGHHNNFKFSVILLFVLCLSHQYMSAKMDYIWKSIKLYSRFHRGHIFG